MTKLSKIAIRGLLAAFLIGCALNPAQAAPVIGTFDSSRSTLNIVSELSSAQLIASVNSNFPGTTYATSPTLTPGFLGGVDMLIIHSADTSSTGIAPLTGAEQTALFDFVQGGGRALLLADAFGDLFAAAQSFVDPFGMTIIDDGISGVQNVTPIAPAHPVIDGPFGTTTSFPVLGAGLFSDLGPSATALATMDATSLPVLAAIEANSLGPGSGRVLLYTDSTLFADDDEPGGFSLTETLFLNSVHYLVVPEPSGVTLALLAAAGVGFAAVRRIRRNRR